MPLEYQNDWESEKLWIAVTNAINKDDQQAATEAKTVLEEAQRERAKERKALGQEWVPKLFVQVRIYYLTTIYILEIKNEFMDILFVYFRILFRVTGCIVTPTSVHGILGMTLCSTNTITLLAQKRDIKHQ